MPRSRRILSPSGVVGPLAASTTYLASTWPAVSALITPSMAAGTNTSQGMLNIVPLSIASPANKCTKEYYTFFSCQIIRCAGTRAVSKGCQNAKPPVGLARSKQDAITVGTVLGICTGYCQAGQTVASLCTCTLCKHLTLLNMQDQHNSPNTWKEGKQAHYMYRVPLLLGAEMSTLM